MNRLLIQLVLLFVASSIKREHHGGPLLLLQVEAYIGSTLCDVAVTNAVKGASSFFHPLTGTTKEEDAHITTQRGRRKRRQDSSTFMDFINKNRKPSVVAAIVVPKPCKKKKTNQIKNRTNHKNDGATLTNQSATSNIHKEALTATTTTSTSSKLKTNTAAANEAAQSLNSIDFLKELCRRKNTFDVKYYTKSAIRSPSSSFISQVIPHGGGGGGGTVTRQQHAVGVARTSRKQLTTRSSVCEYIGKLGFIGGNKGIQFRETIQISDCSNQVHCVTDVYYKHKWKTCATVDCTITTVADENEQSSPRLVTTSQIHMMPSMVPQSIQKSFQSKISKTFEEAAIAHLTATQNR